MDSFYSREFLHQTFIVYFLSVIVLYYVHRFIAFFNYQLTKKEMVTNERMV